MSATRLETDSPKCQQILRAAATLFIAQGYGAVSMDAVAKAAGVSKATLYAYFASKDRLFATIISDACSGRDSSQALMPDPCEGDPRAVLTAMGGRILRFLLDEEVMSIHRVVIAESPRFPELGRAFYEGGKEPSCQRMADWIAHHRDAGRLFVDDPQLAAQQWMCLLKGDLFSRGLIGVGPKPSEAEIDAAVENTVNMFMRAYGRPAAAAATPERADAAAAA